MSVFDWQGTPSSFASRREFNGIDATNSANSTNRKNMPPISLPGSSIELPLKLVEVGKTIRGEYVR